MVALLRTTPVACNRCGRTLIDSVSIRRGYGPECAEKIAEQKAGESRWPLMARVTVQDGNRQLTGTVVAVKVERGSRPVRVSMLGYAEWFAESQLAVAS